MNQLFLTRALYYARKLYVPRFEIDRKVFHRRQVLFAEMANDLISNFLIDEKPFVLSRFGTTESEFIIRHRKSDSTTLAGKKTSYNLWNLSGVFPLENESLHDFRTEYCDAISSIDLCGVRSQSKEFAFWPQERKMISMLPEDTKLVDIETLFPLGLRKPWSRELGGRRVLIVHPFTETMAKQYQKRDILFRDSGFLPEFEPIWLKAPQTLRMQAKTSNDSWMKRLQNLELQVATMDFDVALIGCGAYGLPISASIKKMGKKALHIGGALQLFFGILGNRWSGEIKSISKDLFLENWCWPSKDETPDNVEMIENAAYWQKDPKY